MLDSGPMSPRRRSCLAGAGVTVCASLLLAGCSPIPVGVTAVSQRDGHLLIAVMRCDDTPLQRVAVQHSGPLRTDEPREFIDDGRWTTDQDDDDVIVLDTSDPDESWVTEMTLDSLEPSVSYSASAGGDTDEPMGRVTVTAAEIESLEVGRWLYEDGDTSRNSVVRPTTTDLAALRTKRCDAGPL